MDKGQFLIESAPADGTVHQGTAAAHGVSES